MPSKGFTVSGCPSAAVGMIAARPKGSLKSKMARQQLFANGVFHRLATSVAG